MIKCVLNVITLFLLGLCNKLPRYLLCLSRGSFSGKEQHTWKGELMMGCVGSNEARNQGQKIGIAGSLEMA